MRKTTTPVTIGGNIFLSLAGGMKAIPISRSEQSMAVDNEEQIDAVSFETSTDRGDYDLQVPRRAPKASGHADLVTIPALGYRETEMEKSANTSSP